MANYKKPPAFGEKSYDRYIEELKAWSIVTDLEPPKQAVAVALSFPDSDPTQVKDKLFNELKIEELNTDGGMALLIGFMDKLFKKDELTQVYERYVSFDRFRRVKDMRMESYIGEFEKLYNLTKKHAMTLPQNVLAFKLLECALLDHKDRQLVLTAVDYSKVDTLFEQMKAALKKFFGEQSLPVVQSQAVQGQTAAVKLEPVFCVSEELDSGVTEEVLHGQHFKSRGRFQGQPWWKRKW